MPFQSTVDVHMILRRPDGWVLLAERAGGYASGLLNVPGGKLEAGEDVVTAAVREAREELAVDIDPADVQMVSVIHQRNPDGETRVGFFFATDTWSGQPVNAEPDKCGGLVWADPTDLPAHTIAYSAEGLLAAAAGESFRVYGWADGQDHITFG
ncbi:NUDIX domain-containing protein [Kineosporia rhizophila]|uniref:NUDIX domain-containing protein n=1 Tax=Kineosporia TaxID=49184 RepID=UPI000AAFACA0|nr:MULTISPECIES: NUDIX domain-containing protein [Kineosporia]MCE0535485.1 NUDIX domain-containing protein [Kineosporia rhizophila]GLY16727.1 hypothetical protein Kisp01_37420 [Kineosporia sp. NBRC 101677]